MSELKELFAESNTIDIKQKIVEELLNEENLDRKTELQKPIRWGCLDIIQNELSKYDLKNASEILLRFTNTCFRYLISKDRKGRSEYIQSLESIANIEKHDLMNKQEQKLLQ